MNYVNTFIAIAADSQTRSGIAPPARGAQKTIAQLEYDMIARKPYAYTQEDVQFAVHVQRAGVDAAQLKAQRAALWNEFFSKPMACMRCSPLAKTYGWGLHFDEAGKVALVATDSADYQRLSSSAAISQTRAMRSKRA